MNNGFTPIFEWCSRKNRIVVDYPEDKLILTAVRLNSTGTYPRWQSVLKEIEIGGFFSIPVVKTISCDNNTDISKVVDQIRKWEDDEGVIIRFDNGHMVKIKADDYVLRHKCKESLCQEKNVLSIIIDDSVDDIVPLLEKSESDRERLFKFQKDFWKEIHKFEDKITSMYAKGNDEFPDQKEFAVEYVQKQVPPKYAPFMFKMRNSGDGPFDITMNHIKKNLGTQSKVDSVRWIFGGLKWN